MLFLRSLLFNIALYVNLIGWMIAALPFLVLPRRHFLKVAKGWCRSSLWLMRVIVGTHVEFRGRENIPPGGVIIAAKHHSMWETFALFPEVADGVFILKRELTWIPLFGWYLWKQDMIAVDRSKGSAAMTAMNARARDVIAAGRQILIFPEGTRRPAGAEPAYKYGITHLYMSTGATVVPTALNSGIFWPRRQFLRRPGTIVVEFLPPIHAGLSRQDFAAKLENDIETATNRLLEEAASQTGWRRPGAAREPAAA